MPAPYPLGETVTILRPGVATVDEYGNDMPGVATETPVDGCAVWPRTSTEDTNARDQVIVGLGAVLPDGTDVRATDRMRVRGVVYDIEGQPGLLRSPLTGSRMGVTVSLTQITG